MRIETLKNPGTYINGLQLRTQACVAISAAEIYGGVDSKQDLTDFFYDCAIKAGGSPLPGTQAIVANSSTQLVSNSAGVSSTVSGTYTVAGGAVTSFRLPATAVVVKNSDSITVRNSAGGGTTAGATAVISAGVLTGVNMVADRCVVASGVKVVAPVTGTFVNGFTPTVVNGVVTGIVLS